MVDKSARAPGSGTDEAFETLRSAFARVTPNFTGFGDEDSAYYREERIYKDLRSAAG